MKLFYSSIFLVLATSFYACKKTQNTEKAQVQINATLSDKLIKYSDIIDSASYIKLETDSSFVIGNIDKLLFEDQKLFIMDRSLSESIFVFDEKGKFLTKINKKGQGPGEFVEIRDFTIDTAKKQVVLLDLKGRKINFYDYTGRYLTSSKIPFLFSEFACINTNAFAFSTAAANNSHNKKIKNNSLIIGKINGEVKRVLFPFQTWELSFSYFNQQHLRSFGNKTFYYPRYSNKIYQLSADSLKLIYNIDLEKNGIPEDKMDHITDQNFRELTKTYTVFDGNYVDLAEGACFTINTPEGNFNLFYSKKSGNIKYSKAYLIDNPLFNFIGSPVTSYRDKFMVSTVKAHHILQQKNILLKDGGKQLVKALFSGLTEDSNPVIFLYRFKSF